MLVVKEIQEYAQIRTKARAYLCYIMSRNISQSIEKDEAATLDMVISKIKNLKEAIPHAEVIYAIDGNGIQIVDNISSKAKLNGFGKGEDRSDRAYYYKTLKEHRCILTDPYPSLVSNELVVTASFPLYDTQNKLVAIICVDITLKNILKMVHPSSIDSNFGVASKWVYGAFSIALMGVALLLFIKGITSFLHFGVDFSNIDINEVFKSTILLTLSLAIADLVKAIFEEEVLGKERKNGNADETHQTMVKFLGSIIIALSIEALMLVFKSALTDPSKIEYAVYLIVGVSFLLVSLSLYIKFSRPEPRTRK
ncbi:PDC sensor domain-containing protein [Sulfurovum sp. ST-21]|uniref:PDC sensor domain-containing protein n=1 Tax=Sulfurovum indicum TaxID=2779528 RepID=A0A7M1S672_9BACT|nr:PDC sensor domain-containing protein [Sulfurovum indicum]QOR62917.1 PDC sensor domain-containing protein [Sulfurovum indicum]